MTANNYDVVIFDMDGTLCDTRAAIVAAMQETLRKVATPQDCPPPEAIERQVAGGSTLAEMFAALNGAPLEPQEMHRRIAVYRDLYEDLGARYTSLYSGVEMALAGLNARGIDCVVLSNKGEKAVRRTLSHLNIETSFALIVAEMRSVAVKPSPNAFRQIIQPKFPATALSRFLMVGDTEADIKFARNAGIACCWARYGYGDDRVCRALSPHYRIEAISQLPFLCRRSPAAGVPPLGK